MAWNPSRARGTPQLDKIPAPKDLSFPGLQATSPSVTTPRIEYEELQQNEVLALEAIYGEDFKNHTKDHQGAWKVHIGCPRFVQTLMTHMYL